MLSKFDFSRTKVFGNYGKLSFCIIFTIIKTLNKNLRKTK